MSDPALASRSASTDGAAALHQRPRAGSLTALAARVKASEERAQAAEADSAPDKSPTPEIADIFELLNNPKMRAAYATQAREGFQSSHPALRLGKSMTAKALGFECGHTGLPASPNLNQVATHSLVEAANEAAEQLNRLATAVNPASTADVLTNPTFNVDSLGTIHRLVDAVLTSLRRKPLHDIKDDAVSACIQSCSDAVERLQQQHARSYAQLGSKGIEANESEKAMIDHINVSVQSTYSAVQARLAAERQGKTVEQVVSDQVANTVKQFPPEIREDVAMQMRTALLAALD